MATPIETRSLVAGLYQSMHLFEPHDRQTRRPGRRSASSVGPPRTAPSKDTPAATWLRANPPGPGCRPCVPARAGWSDQVMAAAGRHTGTQRRRVQPWERPSPRDSGRPSTMPRWPGSRTQRHVVTGGRMRERDVPISERHAGSRKIRAREFLDFGPAGRIARMARHLGSPQERDGIRELLMRRATMIVRREGVGVKPKASVKVPGMQFEQAQMPCQMTE